MKKNERDLGAILKAVLPELESIAKAPKCFMDIPGAMNVSKDKIDAYEDSFKKRDAQKWYKAIDGAGTIYRMRNPWSYGYNKPQIWSGAEDNEVFSRGEL